MSDKTGATAFDEGVIARGTGYSNQVVRGELYYRRPRSRLVLTVLCDEALAQDGPSVLYVQRSVRLLSGDGVNRKCVHAIHRGIKDSWKREQLVQTGSLPIGNPGFFGGEW